MKKLLLCLLLAVPTLLMAQPNGNNMDVDKINVRVAFGPPIQDTLNAPYKLGELRTRPADGLWYRYGRHWYF